jgi:hypothetical protein
MRNALRYREENWRGVFKDNKGNTILKGLLDNIRLDAEEQDLSNIISGFIEEYRNHPSDWRYHFIRNGEVLGYCNKKQIRKSNDNDNDIILLKTTQLRGYHAEMYTYSYYVNFLMEKGDEYQPFYPPEYSEKVGREGTPCILFKLQNNGKKYEMNILFKDGQYLIRFDSLGGSENVGTTITEALLNMKFEQQGSQYYYKILKNDEMALSNKLREICEKLKPTAAA